MVVSAATAADTVLAGIAGSPALAAASAGDTEIPASTVSAAVAAETTTAPPGG